MLYINNTEQAWLLHGKYSSYCMSDICDIVVYKCHNKSKCNIYFTLLPFLCQRQIWALNYTHLPPYPYDTANAGAKTNKSNKNANLRLVYMLSWPIVQICQKCTNAVSLSTLITIIL